MCFMLYRKIYVLFSLKVFVLVLHNDKLYGWDLCPRRGVKGPFHIHFIIRIFAIIETQKTCMNFSIASRLAKLSNDIGIRRISAIICTQKPFFNKGCFLPHPVLFLPHPVLFLPHPVLFLPHPVLFLPHPKLFEVHSINRIESLEILVGNVNKYFFNI